MTISVKFDSAAETPTGFLYQDLTNKLTTT